jgi:1-acyl-sn-glycerol-3-phosphate acyltransferase
MRGVWSSLLGTVRTRRALTIPAVGAAATLLGSWAPLWMPTAVAADLLTAPARLPRTRLLSFAWAWSALESAGVVASTALWAGGRSADLDAHYALQRWWAARLVDALQVTCGLRFEVDGEEHLRPGPLVVAVRHASIADSLLPAWLLGRAGLRPRFVLKDELLVDPCLDIVGNRLPNHFVDRTPDDSATELAAVRALAEGMGERDAAVIFPEGTVASAARRRRAHDSITERDPQRAARVATLRSLLPVRPGGTRALLEGAPDADLALVGHRGLEAVARLPEVPARVPLAAPVVVRIIRIPRAEIPTGDAFTSWFDDRWSGVDHWVADAGPAVTGSRGLEPARTPSSPS